MSEVRNLLIKRNTVSGLPRDPGASDAEIDALGLYTGDEVNVRLVFRSKGKVVEMSISHDSLTGFASALEALADKARAVGQKKVYRG